MYYISNLIWIVALGICSFAFIIGVIAIIIYLSRGWVRERPQGFIIIVIVTCLALGGLLSALPHVFDNHFILYFDI